MNTMIYNEYGWIRSWAQMLFQSTQLQEQTLSIRKSESRDVPMTWHDYITKNFQCWRQGRSSNKVPADATRWTPNLGPTRSTSTVSDCRTLMRIVSEGFIAFILYFFVALWEQCAKLVPWRFVSAAHLLAAMHRVSFNFPRKRQNRSLNCLKRLLKT